MTARLDHGWQILLADLSLILFLATGTALAAEPGAAEPPVVRAEPVAVFGTDDSPGALARWIAAYRPDPREALTIVVRYPRAAMPQALARATMLAQEARSSNRAIRIVLEDSAQSSTQASFAFEGERRMAW